MLKLSRQQEPYYSQDQQSHGIYLKEKHLCITCHSNSQECRVAASEQVLCVQRGGDEVRIALLIPCPPEVLHS